MFKVIIILIFLSFTFFNDYLLFWVLLLGGQFLYYFYPPYFKLLLNMRTAEFCRILLAILWTEIDFNILIIYLPNLYQFIITGLVFRYVVIFLLFILIFIYKECYLVFNVIVEETNPKLLRTFIILFWFTFIVWYIKFAIVLFIGGSEYILHYPLLIIPVPFLLYNFLISKICASYYHSFIKLTGTNAFFIFYFYILKAVILLVLLLFTIIYNYWVPYILLLLIPFIYYFNPLYFKSLLNMSTIKLCRVLIAILCTETELSLLIAQAPNWYQTKHFIAATLMVFRCISSILLRIVVILYKDCGWLFEKVWSKMSFTEFVLFLIIFWFKFTVEYIYFAFILFTYGSNNPFDYILLIMSVLFVYYHFFSNED